MAAAASIGSLAVLIGVAAFADAAPGAAAAPTTPTLALGTLAPATVPVTTVPVVTVPVVTVPATTVPATTVPFVCTNTYKVRGGDSWSLIAAESSVSAAALFTLNGASASTALYPGDSLCLPAGVTVVTSAAPVVTAAKPAVTKTTSAPVTTAAHTTKASK
ncbi:MAG: LysM domain [Actinomycetota bacterium]|jgi:LysM repeat protein